MPSLRPLVPGFAIFMVAVASLTCAGSDNNRGAGATAFCRDLARSRSAIAGVTDSLLPLDEPALRDAGAAIGSEIAGLGTASPELQGGADPAAGLREDLTGLAELLTAPSLVTAADDIRSQVDIINAGLDSLEATGECR